MSSGEFVDVAPNHPIVSDDVVPDEMDPLYLALQQLMESDGSHAVWHCPAGCATEAFWTLYAADLVILGMLPVYCVCCCSVWTDWMASLAIRRVICRFELCHGVFQFCLGEVKTQLPIWFQELVWVRNGRSRIASHLPISFAVASDFPVLDLSCRSQNRDRFWATSWILSRMGAGFGCQPGSVSQHILMMVLVC
ncbi:hypothetical protein Nepgr_021058 [Nepenthes gracilis]|uniref:Uncharacterized protein n=1 Tax=Nepenthes gracilis TaxID=150966 RepID=A0AAD3SZ37_NEPGR|nr:hypothetical protein Nepgr_021058 [Nepenthes gracilis]